MREKYEKVIDFPLMFLGFVYLGIYSIEVLAEPKGTNQLVIEISSEVILWLFIGDVLARLILSGKSLLSLDGSIDFIKSNWLALLSVLVPAFRSLRVLRVLFVVRGLAPYLKSRYSRVGFIVATTLPLILYFSALSIFEAERYAVGSNIQSFSEAFWWSLVSVTTVGYGDHFPVTDEGKATATFLMFVGIGLFSSLTALVAAWVLGQNQSGVQSEPRN